MATRVRSFTKALSYRILGSLISMVTGLLLTGSWRIGGLIGVADFFLKLVAYYLHERLWAHVVWGQSPRSEVRNEQVCRRPSRR